MRHGRVESLPYQQIFAIDFEFHGEDGNNKTVVCLVVRELRSGKVSRYWQDELESMRSPPFDAGGDSLLITYFAPAELGSFLRLGWPYPHNLIDLFAEFRCITNGEMVPGGNGLIGALEYFGLAHLTPSEKAGMRELILSGGPWSADQKQSILTYCQQDVDALGPLADALLNQGPWPFERLGQALLRGRYMAAVAAMEFNGIPIDVKTLDLLNRSWKEIKVRLVQEVDQAFGVYEGTAFRAAKFDLYLEKHLVRWPRLTSGQLDLKTETFSSMSKRYPQIRPLHELRKTLGMLKLNRLSVGSDGRNRCLLSPFSSKTGRSQPSNSKFIFGTAKWLRGLIKPREGYSIAYCDWSSQEIAIAAALSGDAKLWEAYTSGDPYMAFAIQAGLSPPGATKATHKDIRDQCKQVVLGTNYGMTAQGIAHSTGIHIVEAQELLQRHKETYRQFWIWAEDNRNTGLLGLPLSTCFGWQIQVSSGQTVKANTFLNWPMQAHGAEMLRLACCRATEFGLKVCAPIHDAILIEAPTEAIDEHVARLKLCMNEASQLTLGAEKICRVDAEIFHYLDRYMDENGKDMWERIMRLLEQVEHEGSHFPRSTFARTAAPYLSPNSSPENVLG